MSLYRELKRRNVIRVALAYIVVTWLLLQVVDVLAPILSLPDWAARFIFLILLVGFPIALILAWAFELTPQGIRRESAVDRHESITRKTGRKLDFAIIAVLSVALAWFAWDKFAAVGESGQPLAQSAQSVAVLPFVAMSSGPDDEYFADGLTEEILNSLAQLPELLVTARTSAFSFKDQDIPVQEIAAALGVKHIVEGSVRRAGERLRVTAQLIRAPDGFHLWSANYDSTSTDAIAVQENIAEQIAAALDVVLDEHKREAMRQAGLRDVEAFTIYQKGLDIYKRAHGETETIEALRRANEFFEIVMERVPNYAAVYVVHSDLFIHMLNDAAGGVPLPGVSTDELAQAYPAAIADYEAALRNARTSEMRSVAELDLAFLSGNWRGLTGRMERVLSESGCTDGNWLFVAADVFGYAARLQKHAENLLECDPRDTISWFNAARAALWAGDSDAALKLARKGSEIAPGNWLDMTLVRAMAANSLFAEANQEIDSRFQKIEMALALKAMIAARQGDAVLFEQLFEQYEAVAGPDAFWSPMLYAWGGDRDEANRFAAQVDQHHFGAVALVGLAHWCACGAPWDLEATPNLAAKIAAGNLPWPPPSPMRFPLKDW